MSTRLEVRPATREDADAICDAHVDGWRVGYRGLFPDSYLDAAEFDEARRTGWRSSEAFDRPDQLLLAGTIDGAVRGFSLCGPERGSDETPAAPGRGEVYAFYLHSSAWGSGLASMLMASSERWLAAQGCAEATLWVLRDNPRGRRFYEKAGWTPTERTTEWAGPSMPGAQAPHTVVEVEYLRALTG